MVTAFAVVLGMLGLIWLCIMLMIVWLVISIFLLTEIKMSYTRYSLISAGSFFISVILGNGIRYFLSLS